MRSMEEASQAAATGDRKALEEVVRALLPRVGNLVRSLVREHAEVDDIAQEALVAVITGLSSHRGDGPQTARVVPGGAVARTHLQPSPHWNGAAAQNAQR